MCATVGVALLTVVGCSAPPAGEGTEPGAIVAADQEGEGLRAGRDAHDRERDGLEGRNVLRFDTFGDEDFWGGTLRLHEAIQGAPLGGIGPEVSPRTALAVGLKVDVDALPGRPRALRAGTIDLGDPAVTVALLTRNAVVGLIGSSDCRGGLRSIGITLKLAPLHLYQLALQAPPAPSGSFDRKAAGRGRMFFAGKARCAGCHVPPLFTEPEPPHPHGPEGRYRTTLLKGLWTDPRRGLYHDGRFATLDALLDHDDAQFSLGLTSAENNDLDEDLRSL